MDRQLILGIGLDLLEIERLELALQRRPRLAQRLFTLAEREFAAQQARPALNLAARFCAKEAVAKALALTTWSFLDVEVTGGGNKPPGVKLTGHAAQRAGQLNAQATISLTHTDTTAAAVAIVTARGGE